MGILFWKTNLPPPLVCVQDDQRVMGLILKYPPAADRPTHLPPPPPPPNPLSSLTRLGVNIRTGRPPGS